VLVENGWLDDLQYICEPTEHHIKRVSVRFICDRGVSHEFVRHRVFSFAQESTRYCNYSSNRFGNELTFITPSWIDKTDLDLRNRMCEDDWGKLFAEYYYDLTDKGKEELLLSEYPKDVQNFLWGLFVSEQLYLTLLKQEWKPQQARAILPNSLKTELVMTGFIEDWKHFFFLRDAAPAHPQARELAEPLHKEFVEKGYIK
jgi:thymidylate synthase (FAD)